MFVAKKVLPQPPVADEIVKTRPGWRVPGATTAGATVGAAASVATGTAVCASSTARSMASISSFVVDRQLQEVDGTRAHDLAEASVGAPAERQHDTHPGQLLADQAQTLQSRPCAQARTGHEHVERAVVLEQLAHRAEARAGHDLGTRPELVGDVLDLLGEFLTSVEDEDLWVPQRRSSLVVAGVRDLGLFAEDVGVVAARCRSGGGGLVTDAGQVEIDAGGRRAEDDLLRVDGVERQQHGEMVCGPRVATRCRSGWSPASFRRARPPAAARR